jgi:hypothetical protein
MTTEWGGIHAEPDEPDFVDVHVQLDWVIRVHGQTEVEAAKDIATDYLADQDLHRVVSMIVHEDGVLCDGDDENELDYETGQLREDALTVALYPESGPELPTDVPVAVATYHDLVAVGIDDISGQVQLRG